MLRRGYQIILKVVYQRFFLIILISFSVTSVSFVYSTERGDDEDEWEDADDDEYDCAESCGEEECSSGHDHGNSSDEHIQMDVMRTEDEPLDLLKKILDDFGVENIFTPLDGTALFSMLCKINHSCAPNVLVKYRFTREYGLVAYLVALRDIMPDEELLQSYVDQNMGESIHPPQRY